ncbi:MAG: YdiU family protein [Paracoccaceae bacterium]|nr:YdiU family protein [Paracoccaceae bacterium]
MGMNFDFDNTYAALPEAFYARLDPTPVAAPGIVAVNDLLAAELGLDGAVLRSPEGLAVLAGNAVPEGAAPLAQAYAGHQFGGFVPQLGDGRAILLGEVVGRDGRRRDIQLKGAGRTPYSRMGDGRAWLGPVMREYIVSEAMAALGIPTTRALAAVTTGETVVREAPMPGAVLTRVASSHIRVGTFQYFAVRGDAAALEALASHVIARHYPEAETPLGLLDAVVAAQARLVARWMGVGFIHGVMNTDNTAISGETIDYGPCAFMDAYHPGRVFSSIDRMGRYAYGRQPEILVWNLAQLATALLPLMGEDTDAAVEAATEAVNRFPDLYAAAWLGEFRAKLGLKTEEDGDAALVTALLTAMAEAGLDFTNAFRSLGGDMPPALAPWRETWVARLAREGATPEDRASALAAANPAVIPRTHRIEAAIEAGLAGDYAPFHDLNRILATPFALAAPDAAYADPPAPGEEVTRTFCGT